MSDTGQLPDLAIQSDTGPLGGADISQNRRTEELIRPEFQLDDVHVAVAALDELNALETQEILALPLSDLFRFNSAINMLREANSSGSGAIVPLLTQQGGSWLVSLMKKFSILEEVTNRHSSRRDVDLSAYDDLEH